MSYLKNTPTRDGFFGEYGGAMLPPPLEPHFKEIGEAYDACPNPLNTLPIYATSANTSKVAQHPFRILKTCPNYPAAHKFMQSAKT